jgi:VWFA-related protein
MVIMQTERQIPPSQTGFLNQLLLGVLLALFMILSGAAQCLAQTDDSVETIKVESDLVDLQVSVLSHDLTKTPAALRQEDFVVTEDGAPQNVTFFAAADAPFDLILLLYLSGSTSDKLKLIRRSSRRFVEAARPADRIAIASFSSSIEIVAPLTASREDLFKAIKKIEKPEGDTNFWDALKYVLEIIVRQNTGRRSAIVVMTDGVDNALPDVYGEGSRTPFADLLRFAGRSEAVIYPVYLDTEDEAVRNHQTPRKAYVLARAQLAQLAETSGSTVYRANKLKDLESVYEQIIRDLGTVYSIGYRPRDRSRDGKWHNVSVQLANHPELSARTRRGYYARALITGDQN